MGQYKHLSPEEREDIMVLRPHGKSIGEIARRIGRSKSTVSREVRRDSFAVGPGPGTCYQASTAQRKYDRRRLACVRPRKIDDPELASLVTRMIGDERWSPEQIAGSVPHEGRRRGRRDRGAVAPGACGDADARPGHGVCRLRQGRGGDGGQDLLRAAAPPMAARRQRERQRAAARVLPEGDGLQRRERCGGPFGVRCDKPQATHEAWVQDAVRGPLLRNVALALRIEDTEARKENAGLAFRQRRF